MMTFKTIGLNAWTLHVQATPLTVLSDLFGFYIGTVTEAEGITRESKESFATEAEAIRALRLGNWTQEEG